MFGKTAENGTSKPSGMDMMIQSLLRSMGVAPDALALLIEQGKMLATQFVAAIVSINQGIQELKAEQAAQRAMLEKIQNVLLDMMTPEPETSTTHEIFRDELGKVLSDPCPTLKQ